jgi:hypothetical protein
VAPVTEQRQDLHNAHVDAALARSGLCGAIHLATGRRCFLPANHDDGCQFSGNIAVIEATPQQRKPKR